MKAIFCVQKLAPGGAHDPHPELLRLGKTEFGGASARLLAHQKITEIHLVLAQLLKSTVKRIQKPNGLHKPPGEMGFTVFESGDSWSFLPPLSSFDNVTSCSLL